MHINVCVYRLIPFKKRFFTYYYIITLKMFIKKYKFILLLEVEEVR